MEVPNKVSTTLVADALTRYAILHSVFNLKVVQMKLQHRQRHELMIFEFIMGYNLGEATKNVALHWVNVQLTTVA